MPSLVPANDERSSVTSRYRHDNLPRLQPTIHTEPTATLLHRRLQSRRLPPPTQPPTGPRHHSTQTTTPPHHHLRMRHLRQPSTRPTTLRKLQHLHDPNRLRRPLPMLRRTHRNQRTPRPDTTQPISSRQAHHPTQHLGKISDRQWGNSKIRSSASLCQEPSARIARKERRARPHSCSAARR